MKIEDMNDTALIDGLRELELLSDTQSLVRERVLAIASEKKMTLSSSVSTIPTYWYLKGDLKLNDSNDIHLLKGSLTGSLNATCYLQNGQNILSIASTKLADIVAFARRYDKDTELDAIAKSETARLKQIMTDYMAIEPILDEVMQ